MNYYIRWCTHCSTYNSQIKYQDGSLKGNDNWLYNLKEHNIIFDNFYQKKEKTGSICKSCLESRLRALE